MRQETGPPSARADIPLLLATGLLSASGLVFELTLTRIFSATIWYHYAFVAISVALFGWGLGGFLVYICGLARFTRQVRSLLIALSLLVSVALPLFPYCILKFPFTPERLNLYFLMSLLPFLLGGATLSLAFERYGSDSNRLYFADLIGAAMGTLMVPLAIRLLGAETAILATAILPSLAALLLSLSLFKSKARGWIPVATVFLLAHVALTGWNLRTGTLTVRDAPDKGLYKLLKAHPRAWIEEDYWNAYSRVTSVRGFDDFHLARLFIDSDAWTNVQRWDGTPDTPADARDWFRAFPFRLVSNPRVLVIGPGGGTDVVLAIASGSPSVTAVEMNPLIVDSVRRLRDDAGNLYDHPNVHLVIEEGRNFIERTDQRFDLIVLGFVDSWATVASGGLSLTENYLYTRQALETYFDRLSEQGALVIIRWPTDIPRLVANSFSLLSERNLSPGDIEQRLVAVSARKPQGAEPVETVFMLSRSPLSEQSVNTLLAGHDQAHVVLAPFRRSEPPYAPLFAGQIDFDQYTDSFETMATPVVDDRPFYFAWDKPLGIPDFMARLFRLPVAAVIGFTVLLLVGARILHFRAPRPGTVAYFGALGVGFIVVEIALLQRLILLLGHPIYTIVVILFTLLLAGGLGSRFARRFAPESIHRALGVILPVVIVLVLAAALILPMVVRAALPMTLSARMLVTGVLVFPYGFLMGMPFPLGLRSVARNPQGAPVSALWGINGVASVIGSIGAAALAVVAGFTWVFLAGAVCYAIAWTTRPK
jgi:hypothetical protein